MQITENAPIETLLKEIGKNLERLTRQSGLDRLKLAELSDLNRNSVGSALSGGDMKLSTLIRITRSLGYTSWLQPLIEMPPPSPMEKLNGQRKANAVEGPASRKIGRRQENS